MNALKWLWEYLARFKLRIWFTILTILCGAYLIAIAPVIMGKIVDDVIINGNYDKIQRYIAILLLTTLLRTTLVYFRNINDEYISKNTIYKIRKELYEQLNKMDFSFFDSNRTGDIMSRMTGDMQAVRHFMAHVTPNIIKQICYFLVALITLLTINWVFALIIIALSPVVFMIAYKFADTVRPQFKSIREQFSKLNTIVQENISGNRIVKAFTQEKYEIEKFDQKNEGFKTKMITMSGIWAKYLPLLDFVCSAMQFTLILIGGIFVIKDFLSIGELVIFSAMMDRIVAPLRQFGWLINDSQNFVASANKIIELQKKETKIDNNQINMKDVKLAGKIEFKDVSFKYQNEPVLNDVSFVIHPHQTAAFIGATGSGKSTVMNLVCRFYDVDDGGVLLDKINVKNINISTLRNNISMAMQDIFLFTDTIEGNIAYGVPEANKCKVKKVAKMADAHEFIESFPEGYDTIVGERGVGLSGGQKQRIALARTLLKEPRILILDDTTSSLDIETEKHIQDTLESYSQKKTTLIIAHRISSVKNADVIFVMEKGSIIERGNHKSLISKKGIYYNVYKNQLGDFNEGEEV